MPTATLLKADIGIFLRLIVTLPLLVAAWCAGASALSKGDVKTPYPA
jgi:hypothetical protein